MHGTIHTCIGQEFSGVAICQKLQSDDFVTSNHRCHGHFITTTNQWRGLIDELVGNVAAERRISRSVMFALGLSAIVNILLGAAVLRTYYF